MNQTFSLTRFGRLLLKHIQDNRQSLITAALIVVVCHVLFGLFVTYNSLPSRVEGNRSEMFIIQSWFFWAVFTWQQTNEYNSREKAPGLFLLPASQFEKILVLWTITGLGFASWFLLSFYSVDWVGTYYVNHREWSAEDWLRIRSNDMKLPIEYFNLFDIQSVTSIAILICIHPLTLSCVLLFRRYSGVFTMLTALALLFCILMLHDWLLINLIDSHTVSSHGPFDRLMVQKMPKSPYRDIELAKPISNQIRWGVGFLTVLFLYAAAYFRFKEREV